jgi:hypothetical protein
LPEELCLSENEKKHIHEKYEEERKFSRELNEIYTRRNGNYGGAFDIGDGVI